ncbi:baseplate J protein [Mycobacterium phage ArcherS7]|uniref:Baseplate J protein n=20 Tax=Bixzunavirus TaxID=680114 RepID=G1BT34_9CAUD|nr:baseplate wedge subunit [Mycobacterium phage ScottMcG]YP_002224388.1 baseplate wedge subunit [Mycobacterium phage Spud]YP_002224828.1 baseplate wedge subunit [Mycobacterium phage Rizal]YP_008061395.1 baseplate wedge subunit [Mycobacterium phage ArcherS7]YP_008061628.1 baseplate wedge subunit [Mycobacterium phage Astraea]YP_009012919.1 baseplate wedge subunit [Mycobacterium phage Dandelion]YP_009017471.1 baseplate wedge subunit [Mycobacterium phage MoMoMixon]YP_010057087.1 baseplate wedge 
MKTPDQVAKEILAKLAITAPGFSLELGTPERKIVDAVAEAISEAYIDQYLVGSLLDIESKAGLELEQFVGIFGFGRLQGRKANGIVRVELSTANPQDVSIPLGSQFYTRSSLPGSDSPLYFTSTQAIVIPAGAYQADIPVECVNVGTTGNVPPDSIVFVGEVVSASSVTNLQAFTGGIDAETDAELRQRFKDTFMRNIAGTEDWYLGLAYQNKNVSKAACFGPIRKYATQVAVPNTTVNLPVTADVKYAWPAGETVFKNLGQSDEVFYRPYDDYTFTSGSSPQLTRVSDGQMVVGDIVDVEFEYTTKSSRNDPLNGITNKVDLFVNGADPYTTTERTVITSQTLSATTSDELYTGNFARVGSTGTPSATNRFMRLGSVPVLQFPSTITVGTTQYQQGTHYHLLRGTTLLAGSVREVAGLEWTPSGPANGTPLTLSYVYNRVPEVLNAVVKAGKQITTDVLVHQASYQYLRVYLSVEFDRGYVVSQVTNAINDRLRQYFSSLPFGAWIEISDLTLATHQVLGVDNVYLTTSVEDATNYGIKVYGNSADPTPSVVQTADFKLTDNQLPVFLEAVILRKANR